MASSNTGPETATDASDGPTPTDPTITPTPAAFTVLWCLDHEVTTSDALVKQTTLSYDAVIDALDELKAGGYAEVIKEEQIIDVPFEGGFLTRTVADAWLYAAGEAYLDELASTAIAATWLDEHLVGGRDGYQRRHGE